MAATAGRSTFPLDVIGSDATTAIVAGIMCAGSESPSVERTSGTRSTPSEADRGDHQGGEALLLRWAEHHGCRRGNPRIGPECGLDLAELDAHPADLHLVVGPTDVVEHAVRGPIPAEGRRCGTSAARHRRRTARP